VTGPLEIPPDAVRVWRGFRAPAMALDDFFTRLGTVFIPATVEMQIQAGLDGYFPSVPAGMTDKPDTVPDETAILFWDSQQTYLDGFKTLAVRTYTLTHASVYAPGSGADFPVAFDGQLANGQPYFLVPQPADWMHGTVSHLVAGRPDSVAPDAFRATCAQAVEKARSGLDGGIACAGDNYLAFWGLGGGGAAAADLLAQAAGGWSQVLTPAPTRLESGLWDEWPGMTVAAGASFNMQFTRRWEN
jgi:hypothetical protein